MTSDFVPTFMTKADRESLLKVCRLRAKVAKADVVALAAQRKAEFEKQLARIYSFDHDEVWKQAMLAATAAVVEAERVIRRRCKELGIPGEFAPDISPPHWYGRGENAVASRRAELRRVGYTRIDQLAKEANVEIDRRSAETQTKLLTAGLESGEAKAFLEAMPTAEQLLPAISAKEIQKQLGSPFGEDGDKEESPRREAPDGRE
jgi:hypothetical protein